MTDQRTPRRRGDQPEIEGRFGLRLFARSASVLSLNSLVSFVRAVITAKLFAVTLGPSVVGILAQLLNFSAFVSVIIPLGLTTGVAKMVAEKRQSPSDVSRVVSTASLLAFASALAMAILLAPVSGKISESLTGTSRYGVLVLLIVASFPLYNLAGVLSYVLQGLAEVQRLTRANIITAALSVLLLVPLTIAYGLTGAMVAVLATSFVQAGIFSWMLLSTYAARAWKFVDIRFDRHTARELLAYGGIILIGGVVLWGSVLAVRTLTLRVLGESSNGLYQVVFGLSTQYMTMFMTWMSAYVFPRVVSERHRGKLGDLLNSGLRANLAIMVPILVVAVALRDPLIRIFYSPAFIAASPLIPFQVLGDYARVVGWSFAVCLFAIGRTRGHLAVIVTQSVTWLLLAALTVPIWGLTAVPISYAISFMAYPVLGIVLVHHWAGAAPDLKSWLLTGLGFACVVGAGAPFYAGLLLAPLMPAVVYLLNRHELRARHDPAEIS
jgi:PST family polysaccharide transporter